jgi:hypothetical protein
MEPGSVTLKNAKHEHFAQLVSNGESATQAYILAGYSKNGAGQSAGQLLKRPEVSSRIAYLRLKKEAKHEEKVQKVVEKAGLTKEWVIQQLMENVVMGKAAEPVYDNEGKPSGEYKQNLAAANKALELLGKEIGMFIERKEVRTGPLETLPPDEAKALMETIDAIQRARTQPAH